MMNPRALQSPTGEAEQQNLDFVNLLEKQRELLKHIRSSPDKKKDAINIQLPVSPIDSTKKEAPEAPPKWDYSFERIPNKTIPAPALAKDDAQSSLLESANVSGKKSKTQIRQKRNQAEEWISDWHFERVTSSPTKATTLPIPESAISTSAPAADEESSEFHCHELQDSAQEWFFERVPSTYKHQEREEVNPPDLDADSVMDMIMDDDDDDDDDDFASLEAAVRGSSDEISLEDLVVDEDDDDDDDDDVIMNVDGDEGLLPYQECSSSFSSGGPLYMQELKHRQYTSAYMHELKHRQQAAARAAGNDAMDKDGDADMKTPDSSDHTRTTVQQEFSLGSSPTSIVDGSFNNSAATAPSLHLPCAEGMDDLFKNTLLKLTQSMRRSAETRSSLKIKTEHTQEYERRMCVHQILQSVESSSRQVNTCLQIYHPQGDGNSR